jgi:hypothetical protein
MVKGIAVYKVSNIYLNSDIKSLKTLLIHQKLSKSQIEAQIKHVPNTHMDQMPQKYWIETKPNCPSISARKISKLRAAFAKTRNFTQSLITNNVPQISNPLSPFIYIIPSCF